MRKKAKNDKEYREMVATLDKQISDANAELELSRDQAFSEVTNMYRSVSIGYKMENTHPLSIIGKSKEEYDKYEQEIKMLQSQYMPVRNEIRKKS